MGILVAILIPLIGRARDSARTTTCLGNLRQLGIAVQLFTSERGFYPPSRAVNGGASGVAVAYNNGSNVLWPQLLRPYLGSSTPVSRDAKYGTQSEVGVCPARTLTPPASDEQLRVTYAAHPEIMVDDTGSKRPMRRGMVPRPSEVILMADGVQQAHGGTQSNFWSVETVRSTTTSSAEGDLPISTEGDFDPNDTQAVFRYRHPGDTLAVVFADGHVGQFRKGEVLRRHVNVYY